MARCRFEGARASSRVEALQSACWLLLLQAAGIDEERDGKEIIDDVLKRVSVKH
jgi:hypothetical protein